MRIHIQLGLFAMICVMMGALPEAQQEPRPVIDFAYFADGVVERFNISQFRALRTLLTVMNTGDETVEITVRFFDSRGAESSFALRRDGGNPLENPFSLPSNASLVACIEGQASSVVLGRIRLEASGPIAASESVQVVDVFSSPTRHPPLVSVLGSAEAPPVEPTAKFSLRAEETEANSTGLSIAPPAQETEPLRGTLLLFDDEGAERGRTDVVIEPGNQLIRLAVELFPVLSEIRGGTISGIWERPVLAGTLQVGKFDNFLGFNPIALPPDSRETENP